MLVRAKTCGRFEPEHEAMALAYALSREPSLDRAKARGRFGPEHEAEALADVSSPEPLVARTLSFCRHAPNYFSFTTAGMITGASPGMLKGV